MLLDQHRLISDLKQNFTKEMEDLRSHMEKQQQVFKEQIDRLVTDHALSRRKKDEAVTELASIRQELDSKNQGGMVREPGMMI